MMLSGCGMCGIEVRRLKKEQQQNKECVLAVTKHSSSRPTEDVSYVC